MIKEKWKRVMFSREEVRQVACPECDASPGERCKLTRKRRNGEATRETNHASRIDHFLIINNI